MIFIISGPGYIYFQVWPIKDYPVKEINEKSESMIKTHMGKWPNELIKKQVCGVARRN